MPRRRSALATPAHPPYVGTPRARTLQEVEASTWVSAELAGRRAALLQEFATRVGSRRAMAAPSPLQELVGLIQLQSGDTVSLQQLLTTLQQREDQIIQMLPELDGAIEALEPALHTLGLTIILCARPSARSVRARVWPRDLPTHCGVHRAPLVASSTRLCPYTARCRNCKAAAVPLSQPQAVQLFIGQVRRMLLGCDPAQVQMVPSQCAPPRLPAAD